MRSHLTRMNRNDDKKTIKDIVSSKFEVVVLGRKLDDHKKGILFLKSH